MTISCVPSGFQIISTFSPSSLTVFGARVIFASWTSGLINQSESVLYDMEAKNRRQERIQINVGFFCGGDFSDKFSCSNTFCSSTILSVITLGDPTAKYILLKLFSAHRLMITTFSLQYIRGSRGNALSSLKTV